MSCSVLLYLDFPCFLCVWAHQRQNWFFDSRFSLTRRLLLLIVITNFNNASSFQYYMYNLINICLFQLNNVLFTKLFVIWLNAFSGGTNFLNFIYLFIIYILTSLWPSYNDVNNDNYFHGTFWVNLLDIGKAWITP